MNHFYCTLCLRINTFGNGIFFSISTNYIGIKTFCSLSNIFNRSCNASKIRINNECPCLVILHAQLILVCMIIHKILIFIFSDNPIRICCNITPKPKIQFPITNNIKLLFGPRRRNIHYVRFGYCPACRPAALPVGTEYKKYDWSLFPLKRMDSSDICRFSLFIISGKVNFP